MAAKSKTTSRNSSVTADRAASAKAEPHVASSILEDLPSPDELAKYEKIVPGGAERLIELAEQRGPQTPPTVRGAPGSRNKTEQISTIIGFILALSVGILGGMLLLQGSELAGLILILIDAAALAGVTIYGRRSSDD